MLIVKPQALGLSFRHMEYRKRFGLCVSGYLHVPFDQKSGGSLWAEQSMWNFLAGEMEVPVIDEGISKLTSEFLVHGFAYPDPARPNAVAARARLGTVEKTVLAFGDRHWDGEVASTAAPFERMALDWRNAYGGKDYPQNPVGKGRESIEGLRPLPNLELPSARLLAPGQAVSPAGFGALDVMHPQRAALRGTYDDTWFKEHSPGFPPDLGWKYFNMAPSDQWFDSPLRGDETFTLENLHPQRKLIEGRLPGLRVRVFARRRIDGDQGQDSKLREVSMRLTTVWFFAHAERMVLVYHGLAEASEDDAADIDLLLGAVERVGDPEPRSDEHYFQAIKKRTQGLNASLHWLSDADLVPPGLGTADPSIDTIHAAMKPAGLKEEAAYRKAEIDVLAARNLVRLHGKDPDALGITLPPREEPPSPAELPAYLENAQKQIEAQQWASVENAVTQIERVREMIAQGTLDPATLIHRGPPEFNAPALLTEMEHFHARADRPFDRPAMLKKLLQADAAKKFAYLQSAHLQQPALPLEGQAAEKSRREILWLLARGHTRWTDFDLTGADLSNLDLRGIDFSGALMESVNLENSNLSRATLRGTVLAHARLRGVIAVGADFSGSNLGSATLDRALLDRSDFSGATFMRARFAETEMRATKLDGANLLETRWTGVDWGSASGSGLNFYQLDLSGSSFRAAQLAGCTFIECELGSVDFGGATLAGATFVACKAGRARFANASMAGAVFVSATQLQGADFSDAVLEGANFGECDLSGARLLRTTLDRANLCQSVLTDCDLRQASARGALMRKAVLVRAKLAGANLKDAILQKADLRGADLRDAHLFGADLSRVRLDSDVRFDRAVLERARTHPRLPAAPREDRT